MACAVLLPAASALAQSADAEKFSISLGAFITDRDTKSTINGSGGDPGTDVDLEGDLGLSSSDTVFRVDGYYKFNERHRIDFSWFDLSRSASKLIDREIEWNDTTFPINTTLNTNFNLAIYKVAYTWSFLQSEKSFLGATAGLYIADIGNRLDAPSIGSREGASVTAPLPVLGLRGQYYLAPKWSIAASGEFFLFQYDDWDGDLIDLYIGLDYQAFNNISFGIGINQVTFDLGVTKTNFSGNVDWGYTGGLIFVRAHFW